jgi:nucleotide-binding universal stress UspA family protein
MYQKILVTLDATATDRAIIEHIKKLAKLLDSRVVLLHVATGAVAQWRGPDAGGEEVAQGQAYLEQIKAEFESVGIPVQAELAYGDAAKEIIRWVGENGCDLVAMSTHGHRWLGDLVFGTTACEVRHTLTVPVLLLKAK